MKKALLLALILILALSGCTEYILDSSDGSLLITGNTTTNTVDFSVVGNVSGGGNGTDIYFGVINPDAGTSPVADGPNQTLNLTSADLIVTGNAGTKTISFAYGIDSIDDVHINWGNVSGSDMPVGLPGDTEYIDQMFEDTTPNGMLDIITVTDQGGRGISWSSGEIFIHGPIIETNAAGNTTLDDNALNYLYGTVAGGANLILSVIEPSGEYALIARIHTYAGDIEYILVESTISEAVEDIHGSLDDLHAELVNNGLLAAIDTDATRADDFTIASGSYYLHAHDKININTTLYSSGVSRNIQNTITYFHTGGVWDTGTSYGVDFANWDNGTNKVGTSPGKWYAAWIFLEGNGTIEYVYPQIEHSNEQDALEDGLVYPPLHQGYVMPIAQFVFKHGEVAFVANKSYLVDIRPIHGSSAGAIGVALQNIWYTITSDAGSTTADDPLDTLNIIGAGKVSTAIVGDTLTITGTGLDNIVEDLSPQLGAALDVNEFAIQDGDGDTKIQVEEVADDDHFRVDVGGTEAFLIHEQGIVELAVQSSFKAYSSVDNQPIVPNTDTSPWFDTEVWDNQNEFNSTLLSGTADNRRAGELEDTGTDFSASSVAIGWFAQNTTDNTYAVVDDVTNAAAGRLGLDTDIFDNGNENYKVWAARFTATEDGTYLLWGKIGIKDITDTKACILKFYVNGIPIFTYGLYSPGTITINAVVSFPYQLSAGDYVNLIARHTEAANQLIRGGDIAKTAFIIAKLF